MRSLDAILSRALAGELPIRADLPVLATSTDIEALLATADALRERKFENIVTYSRKVFIPLTQLCRDVCHYCTFAKAPKRLDAAYLPMDEILAIAQYGKEMGCREALFTLGEKPELRYRAARDALAELGFETTIDYLAFAAEQVYEKTGLLPHLNPGTLEAAALRRLRRVAPSMGVMIESAAERLTARDMPHYGSPDKTPSVRLATLVEAGRQQIPFTTGILIGIGETRLERLESLLAIRDIHARYGHVQEVIVQNFRAKPGTKMAAAPEPDIAEMIWSLAVARILFGSEMSLQAPPNLTPGVFRRLLAAGINDWGGVSPVTPDFVNPEAPWPHLDELASETARAGKHLCERLTVYPEYVCAKESWVDERFHSALLQQVDGDGLARTEVWAPGDQQAPSRTQTAHVRVRPRRVSQDVVTIIERAHAGTRLDEHAIARLFRARGDDFSTVCRAADALNHVVNGKRVSYVVNRNINYTNVCYFKCQFCAFSKGKHAENLRGPSYDLDHAEIARRVNEAWARGATEVCMQGGIHPRYTGDTYLDILRTVKSAEPRMHVHAFSPLEVWQGAQTLGIELRTYLERLRSAGLDSLPGTAAEILDDEVRRIICPDKINTEQWLEVMRTAHEVGFYTTATIMYGHVDHYIHWARHLLRIRDLQAATGGFTEFVPLPFVHMEAPLYMKGRARKGPTFRESVLMHAVARLVLHPLITNIQTSWVKMGHEGVVACLHAGANDLGGTLMNESITRAAGSTHGQETSPQQMIAMIQAAGRSAYQRSTLYDEVASERVHTGMSAAVLSEPCNTPMGRRARRPSRVLVQPPGLPDASCAAFEA